MVPPPPRSRKKRTYRSTARTASGVAAKIAHLGARVRELRKAAGLTQEQAAERARLTDKHWQSIEGGKTNPTLATLVGVARALDVTLSELFKGV